MASIAHHPPTHTVAALLIQSAQGSRVKRLAADGGAEELRPFCHFVSLSVSGRIALHPMLSKFLTDVNDL